MKQPLFREKSLDRISSPEQLTDYIRVSNPGVWVLLTAIVLLLVGVCVWGLLGHLDTRLPVAAVAEDGMLIAYVKEEDAASLEENMTVFIDQEQFQISYIPVQPIAVDDSFSDYILHVGSLQIGQWVYAVKLNGTLADGVYRAEIVIESVSPMSFVLN